ncbi:MAG: multiple sugar transport system ATP-binding protein [Verrucomicrobiota bacterium]|jgi:multiple sugar transport system ATP-binding protein
MAQITLKSIAKSYRQKSGSDRAAVRDLNLQVEDHEFLVLTGPARSGKSTLVRLIAGLEAASAGDILIGERRVNDLPPKDRDVALVTGNYVPYPLMSVEQNMAFGLKRRKFPDSEIKKRVQAAAEILGLEELLQRKPAPLSPEQRQRLAIARAVALQPKVFLFDEPTSGLDGDSRGGLRNEMLKLHQRVQATMIYVTRDRGEGMALGGRIAVMNEGTIQQEGPASKLYHEPATSFVAGFLGAPGMNLVPGTLKLERDSLRFSEAGEGTIELSLPASDFPGAQDFIGAPVVLGIRPEDMEVVESTAGSAKLPGAFAALVDLIEPTGSETLVYLKTGANTLVCRSRQNLDNREAGRRIHCQMDIKKTHLFDPVSTRRLGPSA